jgi:hypothetical protein
MIKIFERYETRGTSTVLVRTVLQRLMPAEKRDQVFEESCNKQYYRTLALFSTCRELMFGVVLGTHQSINDAYLDMQDKVPISLKSVDNQLKGFV